MKWQRCSFSPLLKARTQDWEQHADIIFPSVIEMEGKIEKPLARYYLYYSLHDAPGGIGLATANRLEGPWRKYGGNPVLQVNASDHPNAHISSPDVVWRPEEGQFFLYYHGQGEWPHQDADQTTGVATSQDGLSWTKRADPVIDSVDRSAWNGNELSYARVTRLPNRSLFMLYMARSRSFSPPVLGAARSTDGFTWSLSDRPYLCPSASMQAAISTGQLVRMGERYALFLVDEALGARHSRVLMLPNIDPYADVIDDHVYQTVLKPRRFWGWDKTRVHDPYVFIREAQPYLFYAGGARLRSRGIGLAKANHRSQE